MQQDGTGGPATSCFFILVSPTAVVSERFAGEKVRFVSRGRRIVDEHHEDLAPIIGVAFVVVPTLFGRLDAVTDEDEIGVDVN